jgi:hypothetical protein
LFSRGETSRTIQAEDFNEDNQQRNRLSHESRSMSLQIP